MAKLINLKTIQTEKIQRSRAWIMAEVRAGRFPKAVVLGRGKGQNLWDQAEVDAWLEAFIAAARAERECITPRSAPVRKIAASAT